MSEPILFCKGGGCTAKLGPGSLEKLLGQLPRKQDPDLLIGFDSSDDAAVYRLSDDLAIVQTLDFFPPMIEDPYLFGQIAAANALSDIYAMGGEVKTALNIVCFPETMDLNILGRILQGGNEKVTEAGGVLAGGHSIHDAEVKYGLSVTGVIRPDRMFPNNGCLPGDVLLLTKPLGTGLTATAARMRDVSAEDYDLMIRSMTALNKDASRILQNYRTHGCTDVTGFGLLAHLCEMLTDRCSAELWADAIPIIPGSRRYAEEFYLTAAGQRNRNHMGDRVAFLTNDFALEEILFDPQTSGGLLASLPPEDALAALKELRSLQLPCGIIGRITERRGKTIYVKQEESHL